MTEQERLEVWNMAIEAVDERLDGILLKSDIEPQVVQEVKDIIRKLKMKDVSEAGEVTSLDDAILEELRGCREDIRKISCQVAAFREASMMGGRPPYQKG